MKKYTMVFASVLMSALISVPAYAQTSEEDEGYNIEAHIEGISNSEIYLGFHYGNKQYIQDTTKLDENGHGVFSGEEKLQQGIYLIITPAKKYFELLIGEDQNFSFTTNQENFLETSEFKGSDINEKFNDYQKFMNRQNQKSQVLRDRLEKNEDNKDSTEVLKEQLQELDKEVKNNWKKIVENTPNTILASIVKAMQTPETPDFEIPDTAENQDSIRWVKRYRYHKNHYFDRLDLSDERLVRTPILHNKIQNYFDNIVLQDPDTVIKEVDRVIKLTDGNDETFEYITRFLLNEYQQSNIMGMDKVFVHIAEKYYLSGEADWVNENTLKQLQERVDRLKPNLIGNEAPDLKLPTIKSEFANLQDINSEYTVLYFWEPDCGHCKKTSPKLWELYEEYDRDQLEIFAVYTQTDEEEWKNYINDNEFDWINVWDPQHTSDFRSKYDIYSTPTIYLIDKNKRIIAKRIDHNSLKQMLEQKLDSE
ncbi:MAG: DUF5106 domain-containing protein [Bacteroidales bacterium]